MKILLVKPSPRLETVRRVHRIILLEPLELGYIAAAVPPGHDVRALDLRLARRPEREFERELARYAPDLVGISGYTHEVTVVKELARMVRRLLPRALIVVGGHHATVRPGDYNSDSFDAIVRGEGCAPFGAIIAAASRGVGLEGIANTLVPGRSFDESAAAELPLYPDLATVPAPRRDLWDPAPYQCVWVRELHPDWKPLFPAVALVRTSFGCMMDCSFCVVPRLCGRRHLKRPAEAVADEIAGLKQDHVYFCDDETFLDSDHARLLAEAIERRGEATRGKRYFAWARSTTVNRSPELFRHWRRIGLDAVFLGFEATTDEELKGISKRSSVSDNERALTTLRSMGIAVQAGFMVFPGFTADDFDRLCGYIKAMPPAQVTMTIYTPSPGSRAWNEEHDKFVCDPYELHDCMHPLTRTALPLREFYDRFASAVWLGASKSPLRAHSNRIRPRDIFRIWRAGALYSRGLRRAYRDYPREMW